MDLKEALKVALEMEQKGHKIYKDAAERTANPHVRETFNYLADQEIHHITEIEDYIASESPVQELKGDTQTQVQDFFTTTTQKFKEKTALAEDDVKAYETGMDLERKGYAFYKQQYEQATGEEAKKFFDFLMHQENAHYELLEKDYEYLSDTIGFFGKEEEHMFEGG
ncbi:MAG: hypothetical protein GF334_09375 [Candidatus Altiarchaeales archaeon]|nr:hypothetical protein [Candidatus Altiarchaeales archaeon]